MKWVAVMIGLALASSALAAPQRRTPVKRAPARPARVSPPAFNPADYAASVTDIDCSNAASRYTSVPALQKLLRPLASKYQYGGPTKDEFETADAFAQRVAGEFSRSFGDTDKIVAVMPASGFTSYNADRGQVTIDALLSYSGTGLAQVKLFDDLNETGRYVGSNAYGATAAVTRETFDQYYIDLPLSSRDPFFRTSLTLAMPPDAAKSLKQNGVVIIVGALAAPFLSLERHHGSATISDPTDTTYRSYHLTVRPACVLVANEGQEVGRFRF